MNPENSPMPQMEPKPKHIERAAAIKELLDQRREFMETINKFAYEKLVREPHSEGSVMSDSSMPNEEKIDEIGTTAASNSILRDLLSKVEEIDEKIKALKDNDYEDFTTTKKPHLPIN